ncbi:unnamed protein product [Protopolystoma xenopodis]|uniref:Uncharacterized protein n=1 Tax=Protopolystoma xenopodis TaxID=117903 RepID=A0A3S5FGZ2_9PLAT|nr:unnamed protein product [Protopolystoma xenopodis]
MPAKRLGMYHVHSPTLEMMMHTMDSGLELFTDLKPCHSLLYKIVLHVFVSMIGGFHHDFPFLRKIWLEGICEKVSHRDPKEACRGVKNVGFGEEVAGSPSSEPD